MDRLPGQLGSADLTKPVNESAAEIATLEHTTEDVGNYINAMTDKVKELRRWKFKKEATLKDEQVKQGIRIKMEKLGGGAQEKPRILRRPSGPLQMPNSTKGLLEKPDLTRPADESLMELVGVDTASWDEGEKRQAAALESEFKSLVAEKANWEKAQKEAPIELGEEDIEVIEEVKEEAPTIRKAA